MSIVLSMIARNEEAVIQRALDSARPFVDRYCVVDTGSADRTKEIAAGYGRVYERPWVNFGVNRQQALDLARSMGDFILFLDADDVLEGPSDFVWPDLTLPAYHLPIHYNDIRYSRCALVSSSAPVRWVGSVHEYLEVTEPMEHGSLDAPIIKVVGGGARSQNPNKFLDDVRLLEKEDPKSPRTVFYIAQSYRDAGERDKAISWYNIRAKMNGWEEERWYAQYMAALLAEDREGLLMAYEARPTRAEPLYHLARMCRMNGQKAIARIFAERGAAIPIPADRLFVYTAMYSHLMKEELEACQ